jgi:hypothetical protein
LHSKEKSAKEIEEKDQKKTARPGWKKKGERNVGIIDDKEIEKKERKDKKAGCGDFLKKKKETTEESNLSEETWLGMDSREDIDEAKSGTIERKKKTIEKRKEKNSEKKRRIFRLSKFGRTERKKKEEKKKE